MDVVLDIEPNGLDPTRDPSTIRDRPDESGHPMTGLVLVGAGGFGREVYDIVAAEARITTNIRLGRHVDVHVNATIGHDADLDDFVSVYPGATVSGNVRLGRGVTVGTGANVLPGVAVGSGAVIGGRAVVTRDVKADAIVAGVPARQLGHRPDAATTSRTETSS